MQISNDRIDEFIDLWERAFGERIRREEAVARAHQLLELYRMLMNGLSSGGDGLGATPTNDGG
jgi:hypothetical protein